jgi:hypothetical protein
MAQGIKTGGRKAGTLNRATVERRLEVARQLEDARNRGVPLAKDRLEELLGIALGVMARFQPVTVQIVHQTGAAGNAKGPQQSENWSRFGEWFDRAVYCAKELAQYQSAKLRAITVTPTPPPAPPKENIDEITDPNVLSEIYRRRITQVRG